MNKRQLGFTTAQGIISVFVIGAIVIGGLLLLQNHHKDTTSAQTGSSFSYKNAKPGVVAQVNVTNQSTTPGSKAVTEFYKKYLTATSGKADLVSQYGTANLVAYYQAHQSDVDPISCVQKTLSTMTVSSQSSTDSQDTLSVLAFSDTSDGLQINVQAVQQGDAWKIDSVTCP